MDTEARDTVVGMAAVAVWAFILLGILPFLAGCAPFDPAGTGALADNAEYLSLANQVADHVNAPERCRQWDRVGVYWALDPVEFYDLTGFCPVDPWSNPIGHVTECETGKPNLKFANSATITGIHGPEWDSVIVLSQDPTWTEAAAHETYHHIQQCMTGATSHEANRDVWSWIAQTFNGPEAVTIDGQVVELTAP